MLATSRKSILYKLPRSKARSPGIASQRELNQKGAGSKGWKKKFRGLEKLKRKVPRVGTPPSKAWKKRSGLRRNLFDEQDQIDQRKDDLLETIEAKMSQSVIEENVMNIDWSLI